MARPEDTMREGRPRPIPTVVVDENAEPVDRLRLMSAWSVAALALIASGAVLFIMRDLFLPIMTAFVVGVMLSPVAKALEERGVPRVASAALIVLITALMIILTVALIAAPIADLADKLPNIGAKLQTFEAPFAFWRRIEASIGIEPGAAHLSLPEPSIAWVPTTIGYISPPLTGFLYFLVVLLLFISWWPDFRRQLVMTFASRESRLRVLKILNEVEASLATYLLTVACINVAVGVAAGLIAALTGLPFPIGFGTLAATLNFIPIVGPVAMIVVLAAVGLVTGTTLWSGMLPAALFMLVVFLEGQFITPAIIGRRLEINALAVLLMLMFWTWMWGPMGAFLSSPLLIVGLVLRDHLYPESRS
jgi:predicted PurR-regulated permease PerM